MKTKIKEQIERWGGKVKEIIISSDTPSCMYYKYITSYLGYRIEFMFIKYYNDENWEVISEFFEDSDMDLLIKNYKGICNKYNYYKKLLDSWKFIEEYIKNVKEIVL